MKNSFEQEAKTYIENKAKNISYIDNYTRKSRKTTKTEEITLIKIYTKMYKETQEFLYNGDSISRTQQEYKTLCDTIVNISHYTIVLMIEDSATISTTREIQETFFNEIIKEMRKTENK